MKAAIWTGEGHSLKLSDIPVPDPAPGEARVKVAACGLCHTDLHYLDHGVPTFKKPPIVLGHEPAGHIDALGAGVQGLKEGQAVLVPAVLTCGECGLCRTGRSNICEKMQMLGNHIDGAFAEYVCVRARDLVPLPPAVDPVEASIVADAVTTAYHAVTHRAQIRPGDRVAIFGCGGVGLSAVQFAALAGAFVIAVDLDDGKLALARELGASETIHAGKDPEAVKTIRKKTGGGVDKAMECIGNPVTIRNAHASIRGGGRLCIVGYCEKPVEMAVNKIMFMEQDVVGSLGCRPVDFPRVIDLIAAGKYRLKPLITARRPLEEVNEAFDELRAGKSVRSVVIP
ncbi:MAG: alcohol dehydrogenase catalytic domain-containing protein [Candidatus Brocadiae bacterium]|nr:alcohol dehydrogenase catalytic domain-containing protein [Candidatus Brocadiia bacterium]